MGNLPRPARGLAVVDSGNRVVVLDPRRPERPPVILTGFAAEIWRRLATNSDEATLLAAAANGGLNEHHVSAFLASLAEASLIEEP